MRRLPLLIVSFFLSLMLPYSTIAAPKSDLWDYWLPEATQKSMTLDHSIWQSFLDTYVVTEGQHNLVKYGQVTSNSKEQLTQYINELSNIDPHKLTRSQQYAYWVNLYNAITIQLILEDYPIKSITKLGGFLKFGPWDEHVITINGKATTLNDIEHRILRPIWNDPRTHYAVNCASLGCPNLQKQAFTADNTEDLLEQAAKTFIKSDKGAKLVANRLELSSIYEWFAEDFGDKQELIEHLSRYRPDLSEFDGKIRFDYDWDLNEAN